MAAVAARRVRGWRGCAASEPSTAAAPDVRMASFFAARVTPRALTRSLIPTDFFPLPDCMAEEREELMSSSPTDVVVMQRDGISGAFASKPRVDLARNRFPHAIVWGPLGPLTCCCPVVGHMGIGDSEGRIHDFAGPYYVSEDDFMVGCVWRYAVVSSADDAGWDAAIERADNEYRGRMHNICCDVRAPPPLPHARHDRCLPRAAPTDDHPALLARAELPPPHRARARRIGTPAVRLRRAAQHLSDRLPARPLHLVALPLSGPGGAETRRPGQRGSALRLIVVSMRVNYIREQRRTSTYRTTHSTPAPRAALPFSFSWGAATRLWS